MPAGERTSSPISVSAGVERLVFIATNRRPSEASFMLKWSSAAFWPVIAVSSFHAAGSVAGAPSRWTAK